MRTLILAIALAASAVWANDDEAWQTPVAILNFNDLTDYEGHMLSRRAADALFVALSEAGDWELVEGRLVRGLCRELALEPPFGVGHLQQVAHLTGAHLVISGIVNECRIHDAEGGVAVSVSVETVDLVSGDAVASFAAKGRAARQLGQPTDVVVERALVAAAQQAAERLLDFPPVRAGIQARSGREMVVLDEGRKAGVVPGLRLLVYRASQDREPVGEPIAVIRTHSVAAERAECRVLATRDIISVEDVAVAVGRK